MKEQKYIVIDGFRRCGKKYTSGESVSMKPCEAGPLLALGSIALPAEAAKNVKSGDK